MLDYIFKRHWKSQFILELILPTNYFISLFVSRKSFCALLLNRGKAMQHRTRDHQPPDIITLLRIFLLYVFPFVRLLWQDVLSCRTKLIHREALSLKKYKLISFIMISKRAAFAVQTATVLSELIFLWHMANS